MTTTPIARLEALEAEAFRTQRHQEQVAARLDHITNALGDLSQDGRAVALDIREIKTNLTEINTGHGARLAAIESTLTSHSTRLETHGTHLAAIESTLTSHGDLLRAILARLNGKPEQGSGD